MRYYRNCKKIKVKNTNCLFFSLWYMLFKGGYIWAEFDRNMCFWHFYVQRGWMEIHLEQENRKTEKWKPFFTGHVKIYYKY